MLTRSALLVSLGILLVPVIPEAAFASSRVLGEGARTKAEQACFDPDPAAGSTDRSAHTRWAQGEDVDTLRWSLEGKINLIYRCSAVSGERFADFFADLSVVIARAMPDADCFDDPGVVGQDRAAHRSWAVAHSREAVRDQLASKALAALECLSGGSAAAAAAYFADASVSIANAPVGAAGGPNSPGAGGPGGGGPGGGGPGGGGPGGGGPGGGFRVWVKLAPCSVTRNDWLSVARENPSLGLSQFDSIDRIGSPSPCSSAATSCSFDEAMAVANASRGASSFASYCCRDFGVWSKPETGQRSVVLGKFGTAGPGWVIEAPNLCCEEAAVQAGFTPAFCTESGGGPNLQNVCGSREWSVWENSSTGKRSVVLGKFGTAGFGWMKIASDLCCADAAAQAQLPASFCTGGGGITGGPGRPRPGDDDGGIVIGAGGDDGIVIGGGGDDDGDPGNPPPVTGGGDDDPGAVAGAYLERGTPIVPPTDPNWTTVSDGAIKYTAYSGEALVTGEYSWSSPGSIGPQGISITLTAACRSAKTNRFATGIGISAVNLDLIVDGKSGNQSSAEAPINCDVGQSQSASLTVKVMPRASYSEGETAEIRIGPFWAGSVKYPYSARKR